MSASDTIRLSTDTMEDIVCQLHNTQQELQRQKSRVQAVYSRIDRNAGSDVRVDGCSALNCGASVGSGSVKSVLAGYRSALAQCAEHVGGLSRAVADVQAMFMDAEKELAGTFRSLQIPADLLNSTGAVAQSTFGEVKNAFWEMVDSWKTGAAIIGGVLKDCVAFFQADWEAKGASYRIIKGLGAVVDIVVGSAAVFAAVTGTGITAGAGTPVTILIGTYGANTAISGFADLYNCIAGNVDDIGNVNLLKSALGWTGGQVGGLFGQQEMGKRVGEVTYTAFGLATTVVSLKNLAGQIQQSKTAASTLKQSSNIAKNMLSDASKEIGRGLNGLGYIITKNKGVQDISYQLSQLSKAVPNITNVIAEAKLVQKGVSAGKKLIDAGIECVNTLSGWEMIQQPTFSESLSQVKQILSWPSDFVGDLKDGFESMDNAFVVSSM